MGYREWGFDLQTIKEKTVYEVASEEFSELTLLIQDDWLTFARAITNNEFDASECYIADIINDLEDDSVDEDEYSKLIMNAWAKLVSRFASESGAVLGIFATTADTGRCDISENEHYFTIDNLYILNPDIKEEIVKQVEMRNVVQGG